VTPVDLGDGLAVLVESTSRVECVEANTREDAQMKIPRHEQRDVVRVQGGA
jgi:hypothetical protein